MITHDITRLIVLLCLGRNVVVPASVPFARGRGAATGDHSVIQTSRQNKYAGNGHEWIVFVPGVLILSGHPAQAAHSRGPLHGVKKMHVMKEKIKETAG